MRTHSSVMWRQWVNQMNRVQTRPSTHRPPVTAGGRCRVPFARRTALRTRSRDPDAAHRVMSTILTGLVQIDRRPAPRPPRLTARQILTEPDPRSHSAAATARATLRNTRCSCPRKNVGRSAHHAGITRAAHLSRGPLLRRSGRDRDPAPADDESPTGTRRRTRATNGEPIGLAGREQSEMSVRCVITARTPTRHGPEEGSVSRRGAPDTARAACRHRSTYRRAASCSARVTYRESGQT